MTLIARACGGLALLTASSLFADPGQVVLARQATVERNGVQQPLSAGDTVRSGDRLTTASNGQLNWRLDDGALQALTGDTSLRLDDYVKPATTTSGGGRLIMSLVRGAFRAVSGVVGKVGSDEYRINTPVATMGVRGTIYAAAWCQGNCSDGDPRRPSPLPDGLYVSVEDGVVDVSNPAGTLRLTRGQNAFVASLRSAPVLTKRKPGVFLELTDALNFDPFAITPLPDVDKGTLKDAVASPS